jgi:hypothetical protein
VPITNGAAEQEPDRLARFNEITRELQTVLDQSDWTPNDKAHFSARIQTILSDLTSEPLNEAPLIDDDLATATESQLFAILDEDVGL